MSQNAVERRRYREFSKGPQMLDIGWEPCKAHMQYIERAGLPLSCVDSYVYSARQSCRKSYDWDLDFRQYLASLSPPDSFIGRIRSDYTPASSVYTTLQRYKITREQADSQLEQFRLYYLASGAKKADWNAMFCMWCHRVYCGDFAKKRSESKTGEYTDAHGVRRGSDGIRLA